MIYQCGSILELRATRRLLKQGHQICGQDQAKAWAHHWLQVAKYYDFSNLSTQGSFPRYLEARITFFAHSSVKTCLPKNLGPT